MNNKFIIEKKELFWTLSNLITIKMFFTYPKYMVETAGCSAWMSCVFMSLIAIIISYITLSLYEKSGKKNIIELSNKLGGKTFSVIIGLILCITLLFNMAVTARTLPESVKIVLLPLTPMSYLIIIVGIAAAVGAFFVIYSITRIHSLFMPVAFIIFIAMLLFLAPHIEINNILPVLGKGTYNTFVGSFYTLSIFSDIVVFYIILPFVGNSSDAKKGAVKSLLLSSVISVAIVFIYNTVYAYPSSDEFIFPLYQTTRLIRIGDFFQRLEAFFEFIWSISMLLYTSLYLFVICYIWKEIFNLKYSKELIFPFVIIFSTLSYLPASTTQMSDWGKFVYIITIPVCMILPGLIAVAYRIKTNAEKRKSLSGKN